MSVISSELGVCAFEGRVSMGLGPLDSRRRSESVTLLLKDRLSAWVTGGETCVGECRPWPIHTRSCAPSCSDCAAMSSWILC